MSSIEELRTSYYNAISMMSDEKLIMESLPQPTFINFFEIMEGLINKLSLDIDKCKQDFISEDDVEYKEMYKEELKSLELKKQICEKMYLEAKNDLEEEKVFTNGEKKHIIFAIRTSGKPYLLQDIKDNSFSEEYYHKVIDLINQLENGVVENNIEKAKRLKSDDNIVGVHEIKGFKTRLYYEILSSDMAYVILTRLKKSDNDKRDKQAVISRKESVKNEFEYLKNSIKNEEFKKQLIIQHDKIKKEILDYLVKNQRGEKSNEKR